MSTVVFDKDILHPNARELIERLVKLGLAEECREDVFEIALPDGIYVYYDFRDNDIQVVS